MAKGSACSSRRLAAPIIACSRSWASVLRSGAKMKLVTNLVLGLNRAALAEGLALGEAIGFDPELTLRVMRRSPAYSRVMDVKGDKMVAGDFSPHGRIAQTLKDILLTLEQAERRGQQLPLGEVYADLVKGCAARGEADWDNSAVIQELRRRRAQPGVSPSGHRAAP